MAPHETNTQRQARRHRVPLIGLAVILIVVAIGFFVWVAGVTRAPEEGPAVEQGPAAIPD
jgi:ABC-type transporter Mla subunit MlaD